MKLSLNIQIFIGSIFGVLFGLLLNVLGSDHLFFTKTVYILATVGDCFIAMLKMILIPLVFTSITVGIANLRAHAQMGRVWKLSLLYYMSTTALAIILGLIAVNIFKPGLGLEINMFKDAMVTTNIQSLTPVQFIDNFLQNIFINPFNAMANGQV
ncbi:MAG: Na+/H+-dicarboxylate symporter, partial [Candidatus Omnitrophota bacterium]